MNSLVSLQSVSHSFASKPVIRDFNFECHEGDVVALMGPSGTGKSTVLAILAGYLAPSSGNRSIRPSLKLGWIYQSAHGLSRRSTLDNVMLSALANGCDLVQAGIIANKALRQLNIEHLSAVSFYKLSGGEKQRVCVARCIAGTANLILADEPTASLDRQNRDITLNSLLTAAELGGAVIIATHDEDVASSCNRTVRLSPL